MSAKNFYGETFLSWKQSWADGERRQQLKIPLGGSIWPVFTYF